MAKQGVCGDRNRIIIPVQYKRVTCATCEHYCQEDHSCLVSPIIPRINGYDYWKYCKQFDLSRDYHDLQHKEQVIRVKGSSFFAKKQPEDQIKSNEFELDQTQRKPEEQSYEAEPYIPPNLIDPPTGFCEKVIYSLWKNHNIEVRKVPLGGLPSSSKGECFVNAKEKLIIIVVSKIKMGNMGMKAVSKDQAKVRRWSHFQDTLTGFISFLTELPDSEDFEKWIIVPVYTYERDVSCAERFYYWQGRKLRGIKLVEIDDYGKLEFATGPVFESYWTAEKIRNIKVFKE